MEDVTKKLQKLVAQRRTQNVVYDHKEYNPYARKQKSTSFESYNSSNSAE